MYRNIASVLNSIKLDELSRLLNKYKNERKNACEKERTRAREQIDKIAKRLNIIFLKITSVKVPL